MAIIRPFKAFRPSSENADKVASRPYDVLNREEAKAESNPISFLRIIRSEIDFPDELSPYEDEVYQKAKSNFDEFVEKGVLVEEDLPSIYVYRQIMGDHSQTGIVTCTSVDDYKNDVIKKHEYTRAAKEVDRIKHIETTGIHSGPVLMAYPQVSTIDLMVSSICRNHEPIIDFTAPDGIQHTLWKESNYKLIQALVALFMHEVPALYIADGHHRAASSSKVAEELRAADPTSNGEEEYNFFLSVLFPDNQLQIQDYNRVVTDLNGNSPEEFLKLLATEFSIELSDKEVKPGRAEEFGLYLAGKWYRLTAPSTYFETNDPVNVLAISVLTKKVLEPMLGIMDQRRDNRIDFVGGIRGMGELAKRVDSGGMAAAFSIYPVSVEQLFNVAKSGNVMPPKSTWFEPKLRSGLCTHKF